MVQNNKVSFFRSLQGKLILFVLGLALIPLITVVAVTSIQTNNALYDETENRLTIVRDLKAEQIESYFRTVEGQLRAAKDNPFVHTALGELDGAFMAAGDSIDSPEWRALADKYDPIFIDIANDYGWADLFLMCPEGSIVYTIAKENDLGLFVTDEPLMSSPIGIAFDQLQADPTLEVAFGDFMPYEPAGGVAYAFMVGRMVDGTGELIGHFGFRIPINQINAIMHLSAGMGETGEVYLVGADNLMRSDSRFSEESTILLQEINTLTANKALKGETGVEMVPDYRGVPVLSAFKPLDIMNANWVILAQIDEGEALATAQTMRTVQLAITGITTIILIVLTILMTRSISSPISETDQFLQIMAAGDFTADVNKDLTNRQDEIGQLARSSASLTESIRVMVTEISSGIHILSSSASELTAISEETTAGGKELAERTSSISAAAEELSVNSSSVASGMGETSANLDTVAVAVEEMSATIEEIASNSENAHLTTTRATDQTEQFAKVMKELGGAAQEISQVTETITSISAQTNLLALNATIEAARAGSAGKGFAVVANEIKELAQQTANATEDIKHKIGGIQNSTAGAVTDLEKIVDVISQVNEIVLSISAAIQQQSTATQDVAANIVEASSGMKEASERTAQTATATDSIARDIAEVDLANREMASTNTQVQKSAEELARLSEKLNLLTTQYKV